MNNISELSQVSKIEAQESRTYTQTDIAYAAGIVDGEGCIQLRKYKAKNYGNVVISVTNSDQDLLQWLKTTFGGSITKNDKETRSDKHRVAWKWRLYSKQAKDFILIILPYLRVKRDQANLVLEYSKRKHSGEERDDYRARLSKLNHRGVYIKNGLVENRKKQNRKTVRPAAFTAVYI